MRPPDTEAGAHAAQIEAYRRMTGDRKVRLALSLSDMTRDLAREGIRSRHPDYSARSLDLALFRLLYGDRLFQQAHPGEPLLDP